MWIVLIKIYKSQNKINNREAELSCEQTHFLLYEFPLLRGTNRHDKFTDFGETSSKYLVQTIGKHICGSGIFSLVFKGDTTFSLSWQSSKSYIKSLKHPEFCNLDILDDI